LHTRALEVHAPPRLLEGGRLVLDAGTGCAAHALHADAVVNCSGSGDIDATASPLLTNMLGPGRPFRANRLKAGFELEDDSYETAQVPGCFILGPLLNGVEVESHVESILGVYRAVGRLVPRLHARLSCSSAI